MWQSNRRRSTREGPASERRAEGEAAVLRRTRAAAGAPTEATTVRAGHTSRFYKIFLAKEIKLVEAATNLETQITRNLEKHRV